jgi:hypothetical protein
MILDHGRDLLQNLPRETEENYEIFNPGPFFLPLYMLFDFAIFLASVPG